MTQFRSPENEVLSFLSSSDLLRLGVDEVCYIRHYNIRGEDAWVVHAADGTPLGVQQNADAAWSLAHQRDLDPVSVH